jgi:hypothetical protein
MFKKIFVGFAIFLMAFAGYVAVQPNEFRIERSAAIAAPAPEVFAHVNDFRKWEAWSPWAKLDPAAKATFEGAPVGKGAVFKWSGNDKVGEGVMTLTESRPAELVRVDTAWVKPFEGTSTTEFSFKPQGDGTAVSWAVSGRNDSFIAKAMCLVVGLDRMLGGDMEKGLANIKAVVEKAAK